LQEVTFALPHLSVRTEQFMK